MSQLLDRRNGFRFPIVIAGAILATGRRTARSWFRTAGVSDDWDRFYNLLIAVGKHAMSSTTPIMSVIVKRLDPGPNGYWKIGIDDSPTKRFGPQVEAANVHHNPTPGPTDGPWLYRHNWVRLAKRAGHREGGSEIHYACRGTIVSGQYKTFEATSHVVGGPIRVVLLQHASGNWAAFFSTDVTGALVNSKSVMCGPTLDAGTYAHGFIH